MKAKDKEQITYRIEQERKTTIEHWMLDQEIDSWQKLLDHGLWLALNESKTKQQTTKKNVVTEIVTAYNLHNADHRQFIDIAISVMNSGQDVHIRSLVGNIVLFGALVSPEATKNILHGVSPDEFTGSRSTSTLEDIARASKAARRALQRFQESKKSVETKRSTRSG